jgi:hypothetical protein
MKRLFILCSALLIAVLFLNRCKKESAGGSPTFPKIGNALINSNAGTLNSRIKLTNNIMEVENIDPSNLKSTQEPPKVDLTKNYVFRLMAEVDPPVYEGNTLQATHVKIIDHYAFVTYNTKGDMYLGGLEVFDVSDIKHPIIIWQAIFTHADVSSVDYYNNKLYIVGAIDIEKETLYKHLEHPSMLEVLNLNSTREIVSVDTVIDLGTYCGTDIKVTENNIFAISGTSGYVKVFDHDYNLIYEKQVPDARAIEANSQKIFVLEGNPGQLRTYDRATASYMHTFALTESPLQSEAKSELAVSDKYIFAALNFDGMKMLNMDYTLKQAVPKPETPAGKLDENYVTNSVSLNGDLVLFGNGEAGMYLGGLVESKNDSLALLGRVRFQDGQSVNFVESKDSVIFVATGTGGLKILSISVDNGLPPIIIPTKPCPTLYDRIIELFPETANNMNRYPALFSDTTTKTVRLTKESEVYVTFIDEAAGWKNTFGYYYYNEANPPASVADLQKHVLYPNVSKIGDGGGLQAGDMVKVGTGKFPVGTVIGFYLVAEGWKNGVLVDGRYTHHTDTHLNIGSHQQHAMFKEQKCKDLVIIFEDIDQDDHLSYQDNDFNDIMFVVSDSSDPDKVTENFDLKGVPEL